MNNVITIFKKEFYRVMSDRRLIFTTLLLPGLAIYLMYSLMGNAITGVEEDVSSHEMIVYTEHMPDEFKYVIDTNFSDYKIEFHDVSEMPFGNIQDEIKEGNIDLMLLFDEDFVDQINNYETTDVLPNIEQHYNASERYSQQALSNFNMFLGSYVQSKGIERYGNQFFVVAINQNSGGVPTSYEYENKGIGQGLAMLLPMLIIMFLFSGAMSIGPDSIAGEKERGTIATLLITPVKRSEIAIGKVLSLSVISLFSATSSFVGIMLSLDKLIGNNTSSFDIYSLSDFLMLFVVIFSTVLVIVGIISVVSGYAKTIKEAGMLILPFYFISIIVGISTMFSGEATESLVMYMIPIYNSVNMIISILTFEVSMTTFFVTIASNLVYVTVFIFVLNRLFQSEKIMFAK